MTDRPSGRAEKFRTLLNRPLIIGQAPARGNDGKPPFAGESGTRLAKLSGVGISGDDLPEHFDLLNLMDYYPGKRSTGKGDNFYIAEARQAAQTLIAGLKEEEQAPRRILLMGRNVERVMLGRKGRQPYLRWRWYFGDKHLVAVFPHPSGLNHWWNDPKNYTEAEVFMREMMRRARQS